MRASWQCTTRLRTACRFSDEDGEQAPDVVGRQPALEDSERGGESGSKDQQAGDYTIHNRLLVGSTLYISWYTDGIRVVDAGDPRRLSEVAHFVPPAVNNPIRPSQRGVLTNTTQVWGVAYDESRNLVYASDMNSGLWILRRTDTCA
jgi:hypothetical protein